MIKYLLVILFMFSNFCYAGVLQHQCSIEEVAVWKSKIRKLIDLNAVYPKVALARSESGQGSVLLVVKTDGYLISKTLFKSTGSKSLDNAMFAAASEKDLPKIECEIISSEGNTVIVPFNFSLENPLGAKVLPFDPKSEIN